MGAACSQGGPVEVDGDAKRAELLGLVSGRHSCVPVCATVVGCWVTEIEEVARDAASPDHKGGGVKDRTPASLAQAEALRLALQRAEEELGLCSEETLRCLDELVAHALGAGAKDEAESLIRLALERRETSLDPGHPDTLKSLSELCDVLWEEGKIDEAELLHRQRSLARAEASYGPDHPLTVQAAASLASFLISAGRFAEAEPLAESSWQSSRLLFGQSHPDTLRHLSQYVDCMQAAGRACDAGKMEKLCLGLCKETERVLGKGHRDTLRSLGLLARVASLKARLGDARQAASLHNKVLERRVASVGERHPDALQSMYDLGEASSASGDLREAEAWLRRAFQLQEKELGDSHPSTLLSRDALAALLEKSGRPTEADFLKRHPSDEGALHRTNTPQDDARRQTWSHLKGISRLRPGAAVPERTPSH